MPASLIDLATTCADRDASGADRVAALQRVVAGLAVADGPAPAEIRDLLADALDDLALVDAAVARKQSGAVCAALHAAGEPTSPSTRRVVRRLLAAGAAGLPLADLAIAIGDVAVGANLARHDYYAHVASHVENLPPDSIARAFAHWLADLPEQAGRTVAARLECDLVALAAHASKPGAADRLRALVP